MPCKKNFSLLTLKMVLQTPYLEMITGSQVWTVCRLVQLNKFSHGELAEQPVTCTVVHCHEKVKLVSDKVRQCFCLVTSSNLNVGSA